jgi:hypothetical protein
MTARRTHQLIVAGAVLLPLGLVACGSASGSSSEKTEAGAGQTEGTAIVPASQVKAGLAELGKDGAAVVAKVTAGQDASDDVAEMDEKWESIEGTVRKNDAALYLDFEDGLANLRNAVMAKKAAAAATAVAAFGKTAAQYLVKHP